MPLATVALVVIAIFAVVVVFSRRSDVQRSRLQRRREPARWSGLTRRAITSLWTRRHDQD